MRGVLPESNVCTCPYLLVHFRRHLRRLNALFVPKVYGVAWDESEEAYGLYNGWQDTDRQLLDMVIFDGVKGLDHCCDH